MPRIANAVYLAIFLQFLRRLFGKVLVGASRIPPGTPEYLMEYHMSHSVIVFYIHLGRDDKARVAWANCCNGHDGILGKNEATELSAHLDLLADQIKRSLSHHSWPSLKCHWAYIHDPVMPSIPTTFLDKSPWYPYRDIFHKIISDEVPLIQPY
jgi:hypothetical protein